MPASAADPSADGPAWTWGAARVAAHVAERLPGARPGGESERLAGALLNVVWRVPLAAGPAADPALRSVVVKVAPPFVAAHPDVPLSPARLAAEARALAALAPGGAWSGVAADGVRAPRPFDLDAARSVLVMEDAGPLPDLGPWLQTAPPDAARGVLARLGRFVGRLHSHTLGAPGLPGWHQPDVAATRLAVQYRAVDGWLAADGVPDARALGAEAVALGERWLAPGRCVGMGDLWPPSVLVAPGGGLVVIDWELSTAAEPAQDLGHLAAHLGRLGHADLWLAFVAGYRDGAGAALPALLAGGTAADAARHAACERLARAHGPFAEPAADQATITRDAAGWLRAPDASPVARGLGA